jgi:hypothetical protein
LGPTERRYYWRGRGCGYAPAPRVGAYPDPAAAASARAGPIGRNRAGGGARLSPRVIRKPPGSGIEFIALDLSARAALEAFLRERLEAPARPPGA